MKNTLNIPKMRNEYNCNSQTILLKCKLQNKGIEWLIEGLDDERIQELADKRTKKSRLGQLKLDGKNHIEFSASELAKTPEEYALIKTDVKGYERFQSALKNYEGANLVITKTSGIDFSSYSDVSPDFLLKGYVYNIEK